jgi:hypothetical protein
MVQRDLNIFVKLLRWDGLNKKERHWYKRVGQRKMGWGHGLMGPLSPTPSCGLCTNSCAVETGDVCCEMAFMCLSDSLDGCVCEGTNFLHFFVTPCISLFDL